MKPEFATSFIAAAILHALLLFGFRLGTTARPLAISNDTAPVDVNLVAAAPEPPVVAPPPPPLEPAPPPPPEPTPPPPPPEPAPMREESKEPPPPELAREKPKPPANTQSQKKIAPTATATGAITSGPMVSAHPRYRSNPKPEYPPEARRLRQQGLVLLSVQVGADGRPSDVSLKRSSGFPALDQAANQAVRRWSFEPARVAGLAVASRVDVPVRFSLSDAR
jgi:periplasmic protein TonB